MKYKSTRTKKINPVEAPCRKAIYDSLAAAKESIEYLQENKGVKALSAYKCTICGFWHLTSK